MKKNKFNIICSWLLLICFVAGQYMVCIHQHSSVNVTHKTYRIAGNQGQTVQEKCYMCDAMHHTAAVANANTLFLKPLLASVHIFKPGQYNFVSIALILSAGRAPPAVS